MKRAVTMICAIAGLTACVATPPPPSSVPTGGIISLGEIETDATGRCFARSAGPVQTTIVTELIEVVPEVRGPDGDVTTPAIFRNVTRPQTQRVGAGARFETVCPQRLTPAFVETLQRALLVRRAYAGPITGNYDDTTSLAVQQFQRGTNVDSALLAVAVARDLGLVAIQQ